MGCVSFLLYSYYLRISIEDDKISVDEATTHVSLQLSQFQITDVLQLNVFIVVSAFHVFRRDCYILLVASNHPDSSVLLFLGHHTFQHLLDLLHSFWNPLPLFSSSSTQILIFPPYKIIILPELLVVLYIYEPSSGTYVNSSVVLTILDTRRIHIAFLFRSHPSHFFHLLRWPQ